MRCAPGVLVVSLSGFLWVWLPSCHSRPVRPEKVIADTKALAQTILARVQEHQFPPLRSLTVTGLDFMPADLPIENKSPAAMEATLAIFQQVLASLPREATVTQIANDVENLQGLLQVLGSYLGCRGHRRAGSAIVIAGEQALVGNLTELLAISPYTAAVVTLDRLQKCLQSIAESLDHIQSC